VPPPPYPPSLKQEGYHGLQGRRLHRLIVAPLVSICRCSKPGKRSDIVASITLQIQGQAVDRSPLEPMITLLLD